MLFALVLNPNEPVRMFFALFCFVLELGHLLPLQGLRVAYSHSSNQRNATCGRGPDTDGTFEKENTIHPSPVPFRGVTCLPVSGVTNPTPPHPTFCFLLLQHEMGRGATPLVPTWKVRLRKREMNEASVLCATVLCYRSFPNARTILICLLAEK